MIDLDLLNDELDSGTGGKFDTRIEVLNAVKLILENHRIDFNLVDDGSDEHIYRLIIPGFVDKFLYVVIDELDDGYEAFATVTDQEGLDDLMNLEDEDGE